MIRVIDILLAEELSAQFFIGNAAVYIFDKQTKAVICWQKNIKPVEYDVQKSKLVVWYTKANVFSIKISSKKTVKYKLYLTIASKCLCEQNNKSAETQVGWKTKNQQHTGESWKERIY